MRRRGVLALFALRPLAIEAARRHRGSDLRRGSRNRTSIGSVLLERGASRREHRGDRIANDLPSSAAATLTAACFECSSRGNAQAPPTARAPFHVRGPAWPGVVGALPLRLLRASRPGPGQRSLRTSAGCVSPPAGTLGTNAVREEQEPADEPRI